MSNKHDLVQWLFEALKAHNGSSRIVPLFKHIWENHENELRKAGDLFYTWQYDARWAATKLRNEGKMKSATISPKGIWELN